MKRYMPHYSRLIFPFCIPSQTLIFLKFRRKWKATKEINTEQRSRNWKQTKRNGVIFHWSGFNQRDTKFRSQSTAPNLCTKVRCQAPRVKAYEKTHYSRRWWQWVVEWWAKERQKNKTTIEPVHWPRFPPSWWVEELHGQSEKSAVA